MNKEQREKLEAMKDELENLLDDDDEEETERKKPEHSIFKMSLAAVKKTIDAGMIDLFQVGDEIWNTNKLAESGDVCWIVIGKNQDGENSLTLWAVQGYGDRPFDEKSEKYRYGSNRWETSSLRKWLNEDLLLAMNADDAAAITSTKKLTVDRQDTGACIETDDKLWLLSATEAGFAPDEDWSEAEGPAYEYFKYEGARAIGEWWCLRSAYRGYAYSVWYVTTAGDAGGHNGATCATRPCPACVIR